MKITIEVPREKFTRNTWLKLQISNELKNFQIIAPIYIWTASFLNYKNVLA